MFQPFCLIRENQIKKKTRIKWWYTLVFYIGIILCLVLPGGDPEGSKRVGGSDM